MGAAVWKKVFGEKDGSWSSQTATHFRRVLAKGAATRMIADVLWKRRQPSPLILIGKAQDELKTNWHKLFSSSVLLCRGNRSILMHVCSAALPSTCKWRRRRWWKRRLRSCTLLFLTNNHMKEYLLKILASRLIQGSNLSESERAFNAGISAAIDIVEKMDISYYS